MAEVHALYIKEIHNRFAYLATWLPNTKLKLGDIGVQEGGVFKRMTSLKELGLPFKVRGGKTPLDFTYTSQSGINVKTKLEGELSAVTSLPLGKAGIIIEFSRQGAFLFQAVGCLVDEFEDRVKIGEAIIKLQSKKIWDPAWSVVDTLVKAKRATIVVSNSDEASLELTAKSPLAFANLANVDTGLMIKSQQGDIIRFLAAKGLTPLFKLSRLRKSLIEALLSGPRPIYFGGQLPNNEYLASKAEEDVFEAVAPD